MKKKLNTIEIAQNELLHYHVFHSEMLSEFVSHQQHSGLCYLFLTDYTQKRDFVSDRMLFSKYAENVGLEGDSRYDQYYVAMHYPGTFSFHKDLNTNRLNASRAVAMEEFLSCINVQQVFYIYNKELQFLLTCGFSGSLSNGVSQMISLQQCILNNYRQIIDQIEQSRFIMEAKMRKSHILTDKYLTYRELEILQLHQYLAPKEVANYLSISVRTVEKHIQNFRSKLHMVRDKALFN